MTRRLWRAYVRAGELREEVLRTLMPGRMHYVPYSWPLKPSVCPCDVHFCDFLKERRVRGQAIFHFGTGGHHLVGLTNEQLGFDNHILAVTASPAEHAHYVKHLIRSPRLGQHYKVLFADIYDLSAQGLPVFDVVTLFHLCEFSEPGAARKMTDQALLDLFLSRTAPNGLMLFYSGSFARQQAAPIIERAVGEGRLSPVEQYQSLLVYRVPPGVSGTPGSGSG